MKNKTNCKHQLRAFYAAQGLTGKHRRAAMRHDMRAVKKNAANAAPLIGIFPLANMFYFVGSPEGGEYWYARDLFARDHGPF